MHHEAENHWVRRPDVRKLLAVVAVVVVVCGIHVGWTFAKESAKPAASQKAQQGLSLEEVI